MSQDSINLSTSSLFKGRGDFPSRRCLAEWLVKIRIRFLLLLLLSPPLRILPTASVSPYFFSVSFSSFLSIFRSFFPARLFSLLSFSLLTLLPRPFSSFFHFTSPGVFPVAVTVFCFPCILGVVAFHRWRRVNIRDSGARRIHSKLADLDRKSEVNPPIFDRAPKRELYPLFAPEPDDPP